MSKQRTQQTQTPERQEAPDPRGEFAKKGALAAITGVCSGAARAVVVVLLGDA